MRARAAAGLLASAVVGSGLLSVNYLLTGIADARIESDQVDALLGWSVAEAGDVNRDGYADLIVGAPYYDAASANEGAAFVFLGSATGVGNGTPASAATRLASDQGHFGHSVAAAGDVDGDGCGDVLVGAPDYDAGESDEGACSCFSGARRESPTAVRSRRRRGSSPIRRVLTSATVSAAREI